MPSRKTVEKAGKRLIDSQNDADLAILNEWRLFHNAPLIQAVKDASSVVARSGFICVSRIKRADSIIQKLRRGEGFKLDRLADIAAFRIIAPSLDDVYEIATLLEEKLVVHKKKDYNISPKPSGYRGVHLIFKMPTGEQPQNVLIECQVRTREQHAWASLVEIIDFIDDANIKINSNILQNSMLRELSDAIYHHETGGEIKTIQVENKEILRKRLATTLYESTVLYPDQPANTYAYYLLFRDYASGEVTVNQIDSEDLFKAFDTYNQAQPFINPMSDSVLIRTDDVATVPFAYPLYILNAASVLEIVEPYLKLDFQNTCC